MASANPARQQRVGTGRDIGDIRDRIEDGRDGGQLSRREARALRHETRQVVVLADRYGRDGLTAAEEHELDARAAVLRDQVNVKRAVAADHRGR